MEKQPLYYNPFRRPSRIGPIAAVTLSALIKRINRKLRPEHQSLRKSRGQKMINSVGDYYVLDINRNAVIDQYVDPEQYGRELKVLGEWEKITPSE